MESIENAIEAPAELTTDPQLIVQVHAPVDGNIQNLEASLGDRVLKNDVLLLLNNSVSPRRSREILAPKSGLITSLTASQTEWVQQGTPLLEITNYDTLIAVIHLYRQDAVRISPGLSVVVESGGKMNTGQVYSIPETVDPVTGIVDVQAYINNTNHTQKAGAYATAQIHLGMKRALVVPDSAIHSEGDHYIIYTQTTRGFEKHHIRIGDRKNGFTEILSGINAGDMVVTRGGYVIKNHSGSGRKDQE